jgi:hypothetical protein
MTTRMRLMRPIITRDLHKQRFVFAVWLLIVIASATTRVLVLNMTLEETIDDGNMFVLLGLTLAHLLVPFVGVALIVQTDAVVGTTSFWLTRPIPRLTMLGAKLVTVAIVFVLPSLAIEASLMVAFHISPLPIATALLQQAWFMLPFLLLFTLLAASTTNLRWLFLLVVGLLGAQMVAGMLYLVFSTYVTPEPAFVLGGPINRSSDPSIAIIGGTLLAAWVLVPLWVLYRRRQAALALLTGLVGLIVLTGTSVWWPVVSLFGGEPQPPREAWATAPLTVHPGERLTWPVLRDAARIVRDDFDRQKEIAGPLVIEGLPPDYTADVALLEARLNFGNGASVVSDASTMDTRTGGAWPIILSVKNQQLRAAGDGPARYSAKYDIGLYRHEKLATVPLTPGAGYSDGARTIFVRDLREQRDPSRCLARLDVPAVKLLTQGWASPRLSPSARRRDGTPVELIIAKESNGSDFGHSLDLMPPLHPFIINFVEAEIVAPDCRDLLLEIERVTYAGRLLRTVDVPDVNLSEPIARER